MKWVIILVHIAFLSGVSTMCSAQNSYLKAAQLEWVGIFGTRSLEKVNDSTSTWHEQFGVAPSNGDTIFCLLGKGFFRAERSDSIDHLISGWIKSHPYALVLPIAISGPVMIDEPRSRQVYCWLVDGEENLNLAIVRQGGYPGATMVRPETWEELQQWEKDLFPDEEKGNGATVLVEDGAYGIFIERVKEAEAEAQRERIGIWMTRVDER